MGDVDIGPAVGLDLPPFAGFSRVSVALGPLPPQDAVLGIAAGLAPGRLAGLEALMPRLGLPAVPQQQIAGGGR